jgi:hypothetical protein
MRREAANLKMLRVAALLPLFALAGCAYQNPVVPSPAARDPSTPASLTLAAFASAAQAGTSAVTARVQNGNGAALPNVIVTFATTRGTIAPSEATTGTDGTATVVLKSPDTANVSAAVGALTAHTLVAPAVPTSLTSTTGVR